MARAATSNGDGRPAQRRREEVLQTAAEMFALLQRVNETGTTILYVTHDPGLAALAHRCVTIRDGRVVAE